MAFDNGWTVNLLILWKVGNQSEKVMDFSLLTIQSINVLYPFSLIHYLSKGWCINFFYHCFRICACLSCNWFLGQFSKYMLDCGICYKYVVELYIFVILASNYILTANVCIFFPSSVYQRYRHSSRKCCYQFWFPKEFWNLFAQSMFDSFNFVKLCLFCYVINNYYVICCPGWPFWKIWTPWIGC